MQYLTLFYKLSLAVQDAFYKLSLAVQDAFYKLSLAVRDTTGRGSGAKVILFRAVVKRDGVNFWELLAVVTAVNEFTAAEGEDVHAVVVAVQVVDEFVVIAEVVDPVITHDLAQDNMVDGR